jgi:hypothetical protein
MEVAKSSRPGVVERRPDRPDQGLNALSRRPSYENDGWWRVVGEASLSAVPLEEVGGSLEAGAGEQVGRLPRLSGHYGDNCAGGRSS